MAVATLISALQQRRDDVYRRLSGDLGNLGQQEIFWHSSCYSSYTSKQNIRYAAATDYSINEVSNERGSEEVNRRTSRSSIAPADWKKCLFCQNKTHKKVATMYNVSTYEACESIRKAAETKGDESMLHHLHIKLCFVVLKAWVEKQYKLSNLVSLSAGLGQRRSINKQNGGLGYLVFGCPLTSFVLRKLGLFEFIFLNN